MHECGLAPSTLEVHVVGLSVTSHRAGDSNAVDTKLGNEQATGGEEAEDEATVGGEEKEQPKRTHHRSQSSQFEALLSPTALSGSSGKSASWGSLTTAGDEGAQKKISDMDMEVGVA